MRSMGIDPGQRRVGIAVSDEEGELASPRGTIVRTDDAQVVRELTQKARELGVERFVMGLPLRMNGMEGPEAKRARKLAQELERASGMSVVLWDERLTTMAAERQLRGVGMRGDKKKSTIDQAAATLLLQSYLDAQRR
jgi:putative Holliday junction resolvase